MRTVGLFVTVGWVVCAPSAWADQVQQSSTGPSAASLGPASYSDSVFRYDLRVDVPIAVVGIAAWATTEVLKPQIGPTACRWCDRAADGTDTLNGLDAGVRRYLQDVFEKGDAPADQDDGDKRAVLELEVAIPGKGHKNIGSSKE